MESFKRAEFAESERWLMLRCFATQKNSVWHAVVCTRKHVIRIRKKHLTGLSTAAESAAESAAVETTQQYSVG